MYTNYKNKIKQEKFPSLVAVWLAPSLNQMKISSNNLLWPKWIHASLLPFKFLKRMILKVESVIVCYLEEVRFKKICSLGLALEIHSLHS